MANKTKKKATVNTEASRQSAGEPISNVITVESEILSKALSANPKGISLAYDEISATEERIQQYDDQINKLREKLKPVSRLERRRGVRPAITSSMRPFYKAALERLEQQRFLEVDHWAKMMKNISDTVKTDIKRTKMDFLLTKAKSSRYISKNILMVTNKFKSLFQELLTRNQEYKLAQIKESLSSQGDIASANLVKAFLQENDSTGFLHTMYAHIVNTKDEKLLAVVHKIIAGLIFSWSPESGQTFNFKNINVTILKTDQEK